MSIQITSPILKGAKVLVCGIANEHSIAYGCAKAFHELGADLAITYLNEKSKDYVEPLARELEAPLFMPLDVSQAGRLEAVFARSKSSGGSSMSSCTPSPGRPRMICRAACWIARQRASRRRWMSPAIPSFEWHAWRRR